MLFDIWNMVGSYYPISNGRCIIKFQDFYAELHVVFWLIFKQLFKK